MSESTVLKEFILPDLEFAFKLFAAHQRTVGTEWDYPRHSHSLFEINQVLEGTQVMVVGGAEYVQQPGDIILIRPEDLHSSKVASEQNMTYYCLHFDVDDRFLRELLCRNTEHFYAADSMLASRIRHALDRLIEITRHAGGFKVSDRMTAMSMIFELFAGLSECVVRQQQQNYRFSSAVIAGRMARQLERVVEEKGAGLDQDRDVVRRIALKVGYSTSSCNRMFHQVYGLSPRQYLSSLKLKKAKLLLLEPNLPIETVSDQLGYGSVAHFSRQFKRWTGESPLQFKNRFM